MNFSRLVSAIITIALLFMVNSAHALTIDTSTLDTIQTQDHGPFGLLEWKGVSIKNGEKLPTVADNVNIQVDYTHSTDGGGAPATPTLSRIVKTHDTTLLERVTLSIDPAAPALQVTARSSVRLVEVARLDPGVERAKSIPIYAYRSDAKHVALVVASAGSAVQKSTEDFCVAGKNKSCVFGAMMWQDVMVDLKVGADQAVGQVRGDVPFEKAPKGETNSPRTFIVNASFSQTARDPAPIVSVTTRTMETVFQGDGAEE